MENILDTIVRTAASKFSVSALKPYQILVISRIMEQEQSGIVRNQIVVLPTGMGKSLCFLIPAHLCSGITIIIYPILALINDQFSKLSKAGINCVCIRGGQTKKQRDAIFKNLGTTAKIVLTTPESLQNKTVISHLKRLRVSLLVVDEAHVISRWGKGFRPSYLALGTIVRTLRPNQILAFTATASEQTISDIRKVLFTTKPLVVRGDADRPNIIYRAYPTICSEQALIHLVRTCRKPAIVFCRTRGDTKRLCTVLCAEASAIPVRYYHAGLSKDVREKLEDWFMKSHDGVLVATSAYGMGVDKSDIRTVIHHRLPDDIEEYLQESGRSGRDGNLSEAWVLVDLTDEDDKSPLLEIFKGNLCRRKALLQALGQEKTECTGCDVCLGTVIKEPDAQKAITTLVKLWPFRFNSMTASNLLCGSRNRLTNNMEARFNPLYTSKPHWNPKRLSTAIQTLADKEMAITGIRFLKMGKLLYPANNLLYNFIASILRRIDDGYSWIVRKTRRRRAHGKTLSKPGAEASGALQDKGQGNLLDSRPD